jgi:hypothetical protein
MGIIDPVRNFIIGVMLKKGIVSAAKLILSYCLAHGIKVSAAIGGVTIDTSTEAGLVLTLNTLLAMVRNWAKVKWPERFGWL